MRAITLWLALTLALTLTACVDDTPPPSSPAPTTATAQPRPPPRPPLPSPPPLSATTTADEPPRAPPFRSFETRVLRDPDESPHRLVVSGRAGARIDLDVKSADLADVCRLLADVGHVNIVLSDDVHTTVTVRMKRVPWDEALDFILRAKGLHAEREADMILVRAK